MKKNTMIHIYIAIALIIIITSSCAKQQPQKPTPKDDEPKEMPKVVEEMEAEIVNIMSQVDMIPYYKNQIKEKSEKNEEKKDFTLKMGMNSQQSTTANNEENKEQSSSKKEGSQIDEIIKFEPKPITINDILLAEILKNELASNKETKPAQIPNDIVFIWNEINTKIAGLHTKWNALEAQVVKSGISQEPISAFEKTLNSLTISANSYNYLDTLFHSNKLTACIPDLIKNFNKKVPSPIYYMKYHLRQIVLDSRINNYDNATSNYNKLNIYKDAIVSQLIDKKNTELANKLNTSVKDLEDTLILKDLNIIKIKSSIVMANIEAVKEELSK